MGRSITVLRPLDTLKVVVMDRIDNAWIRDAYSSFTSFTMESATTHAAVEAGLDAQLNGLKSPLKRAVKDLRQEARAIVKVLNGLETLQELTTKAREMINTFKRASGELLVFTTNPIVMPYTDTHKKTHFVPLGRFEIVLCFGASDLNDFVRVVALDDSLLWKRTQHVHPHIDNRGICFGSYFNSFKSAQKANNLGAFINLLADFLTSCFSTGWYVSALYGVPEIKPEEFCFECETLRDVCGCFWCERCELNSDNCECATCLTCGDYEEDCECVICPRTSELLEDNMFPDEGCLDCPDFRPDLDRGTCFCVHGSGLGVVHREDLPESFIEKLDNQEDSSAQQNT